MTSLDAAISPGAMGLGLDAPLNGTLSDLLSLPAAFNFPQATIDFFVDKVHSVIPVWADKLTSLGFRDFQICTNGAFATGHFRGPKPREHSLNDDVPPEFSRIIEGDMRIIFAEDVDPLDPGVIKAVSEVTGTSLKESKVIQRWNADTPISYLYGYEPVAGDLGFEWEVCLNRRPYLEIADKWRDVFTPEEVDHQANMRGFLRELRVDYATEFSTLKNIQVSECRYRIVSAVAMASYLENATPAERALAEGMPDFGPEVRQFAMPLAKLWLGGHSGLSGLDRPSPVASDESVARFVTGAPDLLIPPAEPAWLTFATATQNNIRSARRH